MVNLSWSWSEKFLKQSLNLKTEVCFQRSIKWLFKFNLVSNRSNWLYRKASNLLYLPSCSFWFDTQFIFTQSNKWNFSYHHPRIDIKQLLLLSDQKKEHWTCCKRPYVSVITIFDAVKLLHTDKTQSLLKTSVISVWKSAVKILERKNTSPWFCR